MKRHDHVVDLVGDTYDSCESQLLLHRYGRGSNRLTYAHMSLYILSVMVDIAKKGRACLSFFYMPTCPHCSELEPVWESAATKLSELNKKRPAGSPEVSMIRMNTVKNDVAHFKVCRIPQTACACPCCTRFKASLD